MIMVLFLLLVIVAIVLGIVGAVAKGLLYLLVIGIILFALDLLFISVRRNRRANRRAPR
jgi:hypothetical protein